MKNIILVFFVMFLCLQISAQQRRKTIPQRRTTASVKKGTPQTIKKMREVGEDGFIWYKLKKGSLYGAADIDGNTIIPIKYSDVGYCCYDGDGTHYFRVKKGDYDGIFSPKGRCIISPDRHFTSVWIGSAKTKSDKVLLYVGSKNNFGEKGLYDIMGNEVVAPGDYEHLYIYPYRLDDLAYIGYEIDGLNGAFDLNGNLLTKPVANCFIKVYDDKIEIVNKNGSGDYESTYIYGSYSEETRFDYNNYDGIYRPFKAIKSSSSSSSSSSRTNSSETTGSIDSKKVKNEKIPFPLVASRKYKIKSTFMGEESRAFSGEGYVEYKGNKIIINLGGFTTKEYTLNQPPKPLLGFFEVDVTCDEEKGKLSVIDLQNTISIEPVGFSMNLGYVVEK